MYCFWSVPFILPLSLPVGKKEHIAAGKKEEKEQGKSTVKKPAPRGLFDDDQDDDDLFATLAPKKGPIKPGMLFSTFPQTIVLYFYVSLNVVSSFPHFLISDMLCFHISLNICALFSRFLKHGVFLSTITFSSSILPGVSLPP